MKRIAIMRCLRSNDVCTGFACMQAFQHKTGKFAEYGEEPVELMAYCSCNGCGDTTFPEEGMREKMDFLKKMRLDAVHVGVCAKHKNADGEMVMCRKMAQLLQELSWSGITIVEGTHD